MIFVNDITKWLLYNFYWNICRDLSYLFICLHSLCTSRPGNSIFLCTLSLNAYIVFWHWMFLLQTVSGFSFEFWVWYHWTNRSPHLAVPCTSTILRNVLYDDLICCSLETWGGNGVNLQHFCAICRVTNYHWFRYKNKDTDLRWHSSLF